MSERVSSTEPYRSLQIEPSIRRRARPRGSGPTKKRGGGGRANGPRPGPRVRSPLSRRAPRGRGKGTRRDKRQPRVRIPGPSNAGTPPAPAEGALWLRGHHPLRDARSPPRERPPSERSPRSETQGLGPSWRAPQGYRANARTETGPGRDGSRRSQERARRRARSIASSGLILDERSKSPR